MDVSGQDAIVRAVRRLTIAVWALVVVLAAYVSLYMAAAFSSFTFAPSSDVSWPEEAKEFSDAPIELKIKESTVIVLARYRKDGNKLRCPVSEVLKHASGVEFYFKVGDDFQWCKHDIEPGTDYGDGQIIFFHGNPAEPRFSTTFSGDRMNGMGGMPIEQIRELIRTGAQ